MECSPNGRNAPRAAVCIRENITAYPTWVIRDQRMEGVIPIAELARRSGYAAPQE